MEQSLPHTLCSELLLIATLLPTFEFVRSNVVRGPSGPLQQILAAVLSFQASCCNAAAEFAGPSTTYASSSFTRYRNGLSSVPSPDAFFPLTRPQMVSTDCPNVFFRMARFISPNSAEAGSSNFAAIVVFALIMTGSDVAAG